MQIAVLSDIHGNYVALKRCVEYALDRNIKTFLFLGDYVGELAYPQKTMEIIYSLQQKYTCYFIKGNKEDYWINYRKNKETGWRDNDSTTGSLFYTYYNLTKKDFDFFEGLSHKKELLVEDLPALTLCHGSPNSANEKLLPDNENTFEVMDSDANAYILCGHTHIQGAIEHNGKKVLNAGSVGVSLHSGGKAQFMILYGENNTWNCEFVSLSYDVEKVIADLYEEELNKKAPCWCKVSKHLLRTGEISHGTVLARAMELCREENGVCNWPDIPEKYWEQAVKEMLYEQGSQKPKKEDKE